MNAIELEEIIDFRMVDVILSFRKGKDNLGDSGEYSFAGEVKQNIIKDIHGNKNQSNRKPTLKDLLSDFPIEKIRNIYSFYYYGRSFLDGSICSNDSYFDFQNDFKNESLDEMLYKFNGVYYEVLLKAWQVAKEMFHDHEENVKNEKIALENKINFYRKVPPNSFFLERPCRSLDGDSLLHKSTSETFKIICTDLKDGFTEDIHQAVDIIKRVIHETDGLVVVDFLGSENFDRLDYIENDNEVIKFYYKYSCAYSERPHPPHNTRVDIAFDRLEEFDLFGISTIIIRGFYRDKKEVSNYYHNAEKIKKMHSFEEMKDSQFYYRINFDKKQRGGFENFDVTFLPWRYFNIIILPKEDIPSTADTTDFLICKNIFDIQDRINETFDGFQRNRENSEDCISMYGNRFRKIIENFLKFILLASEIMFKDNYEKDMLGNLLGQLKSKITNDEDNNFEYLHGLEIINLIENKLLINLNLCSHDNVRHKIDRSIIHKIYNDIALLPNLALKFFAIVK
ncbi:hypothetical protein SAMN05660964_01930 [Thiothrix caldifontis]|uniref:Uncharacterized protein n=1 Tax=Thiothrix caldifontis TaxID=525918 RepID=A0A1H4CG18_9GAMM|nr:hypothetical protein [Thiothrix caldifontis]SEA59270.1 hypothetical protein SAMN05660964_01930 [Thiothrix caldifontis]